MGAAYMSVVDDATKTMVRNLEAKTGKPLAEWAKTARESGFAKHGEIIAYLKKDHGLGHGYANLIALEARGNAVEDRGSEDLVTAQYAGAKSAMKPVYDALLAAVNEFGPDVEAAPKKAYVSLRRKKQFAIAQPAAARLDIGLNLAGTPVTDRLEASGSFNSMVSHRVRVGSAAEIDDELIGWLRQAYDKA
jgi:predicted transport protein